MTREELLALMAEVQSRRSELDTVEVKTAKGGTPKRLYESLSAFANRPGGGVVLFGLKEKEDYALVGVGDVQRLQEEITHLASKDMEPTLRPQFIVEEVDGVTIAAIEIEEISATQKPCFYKPAGLPKGAFIRVANTIRHMTEYEVFGYLSGRGQPVSDEEAIAQADLTDLDDRLLNEYLDRLRTSRPNAFFLDGSREEVLHHLRIIILEGGKARPTLAGLLMFGKFPQEFFPQLMITFIQYYGTSPEERGPRGERFLDNRRFEGSIPEMLKETERCLMGAMRKAALIEGLFRREIPEYPVEALREALANAVAHRDYSSYARGSYIQIRMFADRLEIKNPGGLFGSVTVENLDEEQSTRNARLMRMMEDTHLVENRGSGIRSMVQALGEANLEPPRFADHRVSFHVTFHNHTLLNPETLNWLNQFSYLPINDRQRKALVYLRLHSQITNPEYRRLNHVDSLTAGAELRGLTQMGLIEQQGAGRWTSYTLCIEEDASPKREVKSGEDQILDFVQFHKSITNLECRNILKVDSIRAHYLLRKLSRAGHLSPVNSGRWRYYVLKR